MLNEEPKTRRSSHSISLSAQSSRDDSSGSAVDDVLAQKRVKPAQCLLTFCRNFDPTFLIWKLIRFAWQHTSLRVSKILDSHFHQNLKWFLSKYPPIVLFTVAILCFALLLTALAFYVSTTPKLNKNDVSQDWNMFLESFSNLEFCILQSNWTSRPVNMERKPSKEENFKSFSTTVSLTIRPTRDFVSIPHSVTHMSASMIGKYIGLRGDEGKQRMNITIVVPHRWNISSCSNIPLQGCDVVEITACIQLAGPVSMFPATSQKPKTCHAPSASKVDFWAHMNWQQLDVDSLIYCRSRTMIDIRHEDDPLLFQPIKKPYRSAIQLHLLHTSFFLYSFVVVVFFYACCFNHVKHLKASQLEVPVYHL